jgi:hypothetical protein
MMMIIDQWTMVSWCAGSRSSSQTLHRGLVIHTRLRSTTQRRAAPIYHALAQASPVEGSSSDASCRVGSLSAEYLVHDFGALVQLGHERIWTWRFRGGGSEGSRHGHPASRFGFWFLAFCVAGLAE